MKGFEHEFGVERRNAETLTGLVKAVDVGLRTEETDHAVAAAKRLQAVEHGLSVMQHRRCGIDGEGLVGHDPWIVPAPALGVVQLKHVVGEDGAELQGVVGWPRPRPSRSRNRNLELAEWAALGLGCGDRLAHREIPRLEYPDSITRLRLPVFLLVVCG